MFHYNMILGSPHLDVSHGWNGIVVGLERDLGHPLSLDHLESVEVGEELVVRLEVGGQPHRDLRVVEVPDVDVVVDLDSGSVRACKESKRLLGGQDEKGQGVYSPSDDRTRLT